MLHAGRPIELGSPQKKAEVIWHPAIGDHAARGALLFVSQTVCKASIVTVVTKDGPATITARDKVVDRTGKFQTRWSGHRSGSFGEEEANQRWLLYPIENRKPSVTPANPAKPPGSNGQIDDLTFAEFPRGNDFVACRL